jgi:hypothetical protein
MRYWQEVMKYHIRHSTAEQQWITANKLSKSGEADELAFAIKSRPR